MHKHQGTELVTQFRGDKDAARALIPKARVLVGYLLEQIKLTGQRFRFQKWNFTDGSRIQAFVRRGPTGISTLVRIYRPPSEDRPAGMRVMIGFYHVGTGDGPAYLYETDYLLGKLRKLAGAVDLDNKFLAPITLDTACYYKPDEYSGLMRLWAQAKRGANIAVPGLTWPRTTGLIRSPGGVYWFIHRNGTAGTLVARKGRIPEEYGDSLNIYLARSQNPDYSVFQRHYAESFYLAALDIDPNDSGTVILTDARLVNTYEINTPDQGTQWLSWTFQRRGEPDEAAPAVRFLKVDYKDNGWAPWPLYGQPNPVHMLTCRVDFAFPDAQTVTAHLTQEAADEMSWVWPDWYGVVPVGLWEWPVATWYDVHGAVQEIRAWQNTETYNTQSGECVGSTWPPELVYIGDGTNCHINWTGCGTCIGEGFGGSYGYKFLGEEVTCVISDSGSVHVKCAPNFELANCVSAGQRYDAPNEDHLEWDRIGGNVLWRQLRADVAFFVQRTRRKRSSGYETRYMGATPTWDAYGNVWWWHPIYYANLGWQTVEEVHDAGGWVAANDTVYRMTQEQADLYESRLDQIGTNENSNYYTALGWLYNNMLFNTFVSDEETEMEWVRVSYHGQKVISDGVYNPITLSTDEIVTRNFLLDCFKKSIWVGGA